MLGPDSGKWFPYFIQYHQQQTNAVMQMQSNSAAENWVSKEVPVKNTTFKKLNLKKKKNSSVRTANVKIYFGNMNYLCNCL